MSDELREILADGAPVSKARLRGYFSRWSGPTILAEGYGLTVQTRPLPAPSEAVQAANHAALMAALRAATAQGGGVVSLPAGYIYVNDTIEINTTALGDPFTDDDTRKRIQINIVGSGRRATKLVHNHPEKPLIRVFDAERSRTKPQFELRVQALTLLGRGVATRGALIALYSWTHHVLEDIWLEGTAGYAIHIAGSERIVLRDVVVFLCRQALMMHDAVNETYLFNFLPLGCGGTADPTEPEGEIRAWGPNVVEANQFVKSGPVTQAKRAVVHIEGSQNVRWIGGSCKALLALAGVKIRNCENAQLDHVYFEGFPVAAPAPNPSVILGGAMEKTWLSTPIGAADTEFRVEDTDWFPRRYASTEELKLHRPDHAFYFAIYNPADPGEYEIIRVRGFVGDAMHVDQRGAPGAPLRLANRGARAWPSGSAVTELSFGRGDLTLHGNHLEGFASFGAYPGLELIENWERGDTNGQIIVGFTHDDFCSERNFRGGDLPASCHLELTGHNRVRINRGRAEATERVQVHHRASVYVSQESQFGGIEVVQASPQNRRWMTVSRALSDHEPLLVTEPGGAINLRRDETFKPEDGRDRSDIPWRPLFIAPYGTVADCRLYSVWPGQPLYQGQDFVASFVLDTAASWPPELTMRYLRGRGDATPHLRLRHFGNGRAVAVELGLLRTPAPDQRLLQLRFDVTAICGAIFDDPPTPPFRTDWLFPLRTADALDLAPVPAIRAPASAPEGNPAGGGELFVEDGALKYRSPTGTVTVIAPR